MVITIVRLLLLYLGLPDSFWLKVVCIAVYILNRILRLRLIGKSPLDIFNT